jgi:hypothetical protein
MLLAGTACSGSIAPEKDAAIGTEHDSGQSHDSGGGHDSGTIPEAGASTLQWYQTCGYPVCSVPADGGSTDSGVVCAALGTACTTKGQTCGVASASNCGSIEMCDDVDPRGENGDLCPVSSRQFKDDIEYVGPEQLKALHDQTLQVRLATYHYKSQVADPIPGHLGFIIEDNRDSPAVNARHDRVDIYAYLSMVVATTQVQEQEIAALRAEVESLKAEKTRAMRRP